MEEENRAIDRKLIFCTIEYLQAGRGDWWWWCPHSWWFYFQQRNVSIKRHEHGEKGRQMMNKKIFSKRKPHGRSWVETIHQFWFVVVPIDTSKVGYKFWKMKTNRYKIIKHTLWRKTSFLTAVNFEKKIYADKIWQLFFFLIH